MSFNYRFPPSKHPVLAFRGAPASFPIQEQHRHLQRLLQWSSNIKSLADEYITKNLRAGPFIGIHLRNEEAWVGQLVAVGFWREIHAQAN